MRRQQLPHVVPRDVTEVILPAGAAWSCGVKRVCAIAMLVRKQVRSQCERWIVRATCFLLLKPLMRPGIAG